MKNLSPYQFKDYLKALKKQYQRYLFDDFLPYMNAHVIDWEYGGFMCNTNRKGENVTTDKRTWYDGRGVWVYSTLYLNFGKEKKYLDIAKRTLDFVIDKIKPADDRIWPDTYTRKGIPLPNVKGDIYGELFVAEGMIAYARATGENRFLEEAKSILFQEAKRSEDYQYQPHYNSDDIGIKSPRVLGHWMDFLNHSTQILDQDSDSRVKEICDRSINALLNYHLQSEFNLMVEYLNNDFSRPLGKLNQFSYIGHAIETLWLLMAEAKRRQDNGLFSKAANLFRRHVEVAWDDVYGGFFHCLKHIDRNEWLLDKVLWAQEEVMVGLMFLAEEGDDWAKQWIPKVWEYLNQMFVLSDHPNRLWINGGNRKMTEHHQVDRFENYHHPRHLMFNLLRLERMTKE